MYYFATNPTMKVKTIFIFASLFTVATLAVIIIPSAVYFGARLETAMCKILSCGVNATANDPNWTGLVYDAYTVFELDHNHVKYIGTDKETFSAQLDALNYCNSYMVGSDRQCYYYKNSIANTLTLSLNTLITAVVSLVSVFGGLLLLTTIYLWIVYVTKNYCCCDIEKEKTYQKLVN